MIDIEVTVTCDTCGFSDGQFCDDEYKVGSFLHRLEGMGWGEELSVCPDCATKVLECTWCFETVLEGIDLTSIGWRQFLSADGAVTITLCDECGANYDRFRD